MSPARPASSRRGFTLAEALVLIGILAVLVFVLMPASLDAEVSDRVRCGAGLRRLTQNMRVYAGDHDDAFPVAGAQDAALPAQGFRPADLRGRADVPADDPARVNNVSASLWLLVRDYGVYAGSFLCESSDDADRDFGFGGEPTDPDLTWDFAAREDLSYSTLNMYHEGVRSADLWSYNVPGDVALMADRNDGDHPAVHTPDSPNDNSPNHDGEGQNFAFGDGHVEFVENPKVGPGGDDVYAMLFDGTPGPPTLGLTDGDMADPKTTGVSARRDNVLIPLSGNNGVSLSGLPGEVVAPRPEKAAGLSAGTIALISVGGLAGLVVILLLALRLSWRKSAAGEVEEG